MVRLGRIRTVHRHHVARPQQVVKREPNGTEFGDEVRMDLATVRIRDLHATRLGPSSGGGTDGTHSNNSEAFRLNAGTEHHEHAPLPRLTGTDQPFAFAEPTCRHEDERQCNVGRGLGQDARGVRGHGTTRPDGRNIKVVVADGHIGDDLQLRSGGIEQFSVDPLGEQRHDGVGPGHPRQQFGAGNRLRVGPGNHVVASPGEKIDAGLGDSTGDDNLFVAHTVIQSRSLPRPSRMSSALIPE